MLVREYAKQVIGCRGIYICRLVYELITERSSRKKRLIECVDKTTLPHHFTILLVEFVSVIKIRGKKR